MLLIQIVIWKLATALMKFDNLQSNEFVTRLYINSHKMHFNFDRINCLQSFEENLKLIQLKK